MRFAVHRIQRLEKALAIPWPAATPWEVVQQAAARLIPAFAELAEQAAEGTVLYNDDTTKRILNFTQEARVEALPPGARREYIWRCRQWLLPLFRIKH